MIFLLQSYLFVVKNCQKFKTSSLLLQKYKKLILKYINILKAIEITENQFQKKNFFNWK